MSRVSRVCRVSRFSRVSLRPSCRLSHDGRNARERIGVRKSLSGPMAAGGS